MKHLIFISLLLAIAACKNEQPRQEAVTATDANVDSLVTSMAEERQSIEADEKFMAVFAIVNDVDGYSVVRDSPEKSGAVVDRLQTGTIVFCMEPSGDWIGIDYYSVGARKDDFKHGFIHKSRLTLVDQYTPVTGMVETGNSVVLGDDRINITVTQENFDSSEHIQEYDKQHKYLETIDGRTFWGTDGNEPKWEYKSITINLNGTETEIPAMGLDQLYEPNLNNTSANYDAKNDVLYVQSYNSDGAGGYCVLWRIENGRYKDRWVYNGF